ncbi:hypothetical protein [Streptomyces sp. NBC_00847]|uniref:hypothetical protein n=1 Tax=Streptomyces sp. NBC_00847 TaxID=2975850 RepID=UPI0022541762|nr:hypothetical protein [Streptomyces sp. NBC_00847]MCX4882787.1 hypothetical protein [Streptomyces sp. NBC_00847]
MRRWPGTIGTFLVTPVALTGCAWLAQRQGTPVLLLGAFLAMVVLLGAWVMCGVGPGLGVAVSGFAFMLFVGPAMNDYVIDHRGVRHEAVVADTGSYYRKHGDGRTCRVVLTDTPKSSSYEVDDMTGCDDGLKPGRQVTLVADPDGWLVPRLSSEVDGVAPWLIRTCAGLLTMMEAFVLYGRLRRRRG